MNPAHHFTVKPGEYFRRKYDGAILRASMEQGLERAHFEPVSIVTLRPKPAPKRKWTRKDAWAWIREWNDDYERDGVLSIGTQSSVGSDPHVDYYVCLDMGGKTSYFTYATSITRAVLNAKRALRRK